MKRFLLTLGILLLLVGQGWGTDFAPHKMTANNLPAPYVASASTAELAAYLAFDGAVTTGSTGWRTVSGNTTGWIKIDLGSGNGQIAKSYSIQAKNSTTRCPAEWVFEGSNDDSAYDTLDSQTGQTTWSNYLVKTYAISNTTAYRYYRVTVTANNGDANYLEVGELFINTAASNTNYYVNSAVVSNGNGSLATPWKTLANIYTGEITNSVAAGDTVFLNLAMDGSWQEDYTVTVSGVNGRPVTWQPYGSGTNMPTFNILTGQGFKVNASYNTFNRIHYSGDQLQNTYAVYTYTGTLGNIFNYCNIESSGGYNSNTNLFNADGNSSVAINNCSLNRAWFAIYSKSTASVTLRNSQVYGNYTPFKKDAGAAIDFDYCHIAGYYTSGTALVGTNGGHNIVGGVIPCKTLFQYPNAPIINISFDDQNDTIGGSYNYANADSAISIMAGKGAYVPTLCLPVGRTLASGTLAKVQSWYGAGIDIASHGWSHIYYDAPNMFTIHYTGSGSAATLTISDNVLTTDVTDAPADNLNIDLTASPNDIVGKSGIANSLYTTITATGKYTITPTKTTEPDCYVHSKIAADQAGIEIKVATPTVAADVTRLFIDELSASSAYWQANLTGWTPISYAWPGGKYNATGTGLLPTYYYGARSTTQTYTNRLVNGIDANILDCYQDPGYGGNQAAITEQARGIAYFYGMTGRICSLYGHMTGAGALTATEWGYILDGIISTKVSYGTLTQIFTYLHTQTNVSANTWRVTAAPTATDYHLITGDTTLVKKGTPISGYSGSDYFGGTVHTTPNIGLDDTQLSGGGLSPGLGISGGNVPPWLRH